MRKKKPKGQNNPIIRINKIKIIINSKLSLLIKEKFKTNDECIEEVNQYLEVMNKNDKIYGEGLDD